VTEVTVVEVYQTQEQPSSLTADCKNWTRGELPVVEGPKKRQSHKAPQRAHRGHVVDSLALPELLGVRKMVVWHLNPFRHSL